MNHSLAELALAVAVVYLTGLIIYRLFLSPIASIPGPKLAALTQWYETYYEMFAPPAVGQYMFHYRELHEKYGPIVRISPREVHIQDSDFFSQMYSQKMLWDKPEYLQDRFGISTGILSTAFHELHRNRRLALNPFFSTRAIKDFSPMMQKRMDRLCNRIVREYKSNGKVLRLDWMFGCYAADNIVAYCLEHEYGWIDSPDLYCKFVGSMNALLQNVHLVTQFPWIGKFMMALPKNLMATVSPEMKVFHDFEQEMIDQISHILATDRADGKDSRQISHDGEIPKQKSVFRALLDSNLPEEELSQLRMQHEALTLIGAGMETIKWALTVGSFHILDNPKVMQRLRAELEQAIPDPNQMLALDDLEKLPYLDACAQESLRLTYGTTGRSHRVSDNIRLQYGSHVIPPGITVGMDNYAVSHDERIFPDSFNFHPERWLGDPRAPDGKPLSTYMVSFGRGTRQCLGKPMAMAELYIAMANLYRKFDFTLFETDRTSVDCVSDLFGPRPAAGTQGVRVTVQ